MNEEVPMAKITTVGRFAADYRTEFTLIIGRGYAEEFCLERLFFPNTETLKNVRAFEAFLIDIRGDKKPAKASYLDWVRAEIKRLGFMAPRLRELVPFIHNFHRHELVLGSHVMATRQVWRDPKTGNRYCPSGTGVEGPAFSVRFSKEQVFGHWQGCVKPSLYLALRDITEEMLAEIARQDMVGP